METRLKAVRVQEVILNNEFNPERYEILGNGDAVGTILYSELNQTLPYNKSTDRLGFAKPLFASITQYPLVNEIVYLVKGPSPLYYDKKEIISYYLPAIKVQNHPLHNAFPTTLESDNIVLSNEEVEGGAQPSNDQEFSINLGEYFSELEEIRPLRPYEGDTIVEGRFGNSIRLGATTYNQLKDINRWSNEGEIGNPITIIRNGQREDELKESFEHVLEDIDNDDSSIYLCSNQQITGFIPASNYQLSFGANLEAVQKVEPVINNDPLPEDVEEEITVTPPPTPPEPEDIPPIEETEDVADYDDAPTEEQTLFPDEDLGDLPSSYENTEGIDVERQLGPPISTPPPLHADAEESIDIDETMATFADMRIQADKSPFGFYLSQQGPFNRIALKDKDMKLIYETDRSSGTVAELINETKVALGI